MIFTNNFAYEDNLDLYMPYGNVTQKTFNQNIKVILFENYITFLHSFYEEIVLQSLTEYHQFCNDTTDKFVSVVNAVCIDIVRTELLT